MESAIALLFFMVIILLMIGLVLQIQADFLSLSTNEQRILSLERERAKENAEMEWIGGYDLYLSNIGTNTSIRYVYVYVNGSRSPSYYLDVHNLTALNCTQDYGCIPIWNYYASEGGILLKPNSRIRLNLQQFGDWRILYNQAQISRGSSNLKQVLIPSESRPIKYFKDEQFLNTSWLDFGADGYALYRNLSAITRPVVDTGFPSGPNWTACFWLKIVAPQASPDNWTVLDLDSFQVMVDPNVEGSESYPKIFIRVNGPTGPIDLTQSTNYVNATGWNHYCIVTNETKLIFYVNGRKVDIKGYSSSYSISQIRLPHRKYEKAKIAAFDDLYVTPNYLDENNIRALAARAMPSNPTNYIYFSVDQLSNRITRVDVLTDMGVVFTSSRPKT